LADELLSTHEAEIESIILLPSDGGRFEVSVNDHLLYSKLETHRHQLQGEIVGLLDAYLKEHK